ncbi:probable cytochrome P450 6a13 [Rhopalosiphum padi]|uniref:CYP6CY9 n=1 Tax=Rhopalosiphum padi TaxID=40932 RepID=A0A6H1X487_RHOPD|nr:probable cytochrome P450 6a13 [Rhopalosiphum padi]QJA10282.1 CYP6CY9 [Rhopalosiphum padi]UOW66132.1 cytochrome P450 6CY9 [Rhopalosiphum padi]WOV89623.1 cytochrome P450 CYP6CY9 [Rhopalosiphum padi]
MTAARLLLELATSWWTIAALATFAAVAYRFATSTFGYWRDRGVPDVRPTVPLFGNLFGMAMAAEHQSRMYGRIYDGFRGRRYGGLYQMRTPHLMVCDPALVNRVLIGDFAHFTDHGLYTAGPDENPLANGLFNMNGAQWKIMRQKLSPVFTAGKLRHMRGQVAACSEQLMRNVAADVAAGGPVEVRDALGKYSTDVIGTCAFGLQLNAINDEQSAFRKYGKAVFAPSFRTIFKELLWMVSPALRRALRVGDFPRDAVEFFTAAFTDTMRYRQEHGLVRDDVVQSLIQARTDLVVNKTEPSVTFLETDIVANAFVLFAAGFETVSTAMSFCLYELALKKPIQDKVREEMNAMKIKRNTEVDDDFLKELHYLDMVLAETLRKYPPLITLFREATQDYKVPDDTLVIEKGTKILIPAYAIHHDYRYYPDPETFDPERFSPEEKAKRPNGTYMPFGDGPRLCIGKRFAEMEMKLALTELLTKYEVEPCEKTDIPMQFSKRSIITMPENGIWLKFKPINTPK